MRILGISGSLRKGSTNTAILAAAGRLAAPGATFELYQDLGELPHFNPDLDAEPLPAAVARLRGAVSSADALLISTPEYAHGIPGALKNALDWLVSDPAFASKRVGVLFGSASDGSFAQRALLEVLRTMSAVVIEDAVVSLSGVRARVGPDGRISDARTEERLKAVMSALGGG